MATVQGQVSQPPGSPSGTVDGVPRGSSSGSDRVAATRERILAAFLAVATERGLDAATTREIAHRAGINEVTLFRHFGDKAGLALAAVRHFSPVASLREQAPAIDASSPRRAAAGLLACLQWCHERIQRRPEMLQFGVGQAWRVPAEVAAEMAAIPEAVMAYFDRALRQAAPALRPEVDRQAVVLQWLGLLATTQLLVARGVVAAPSAADWDRMLRSAVLTVIDRTDTDEERISR